MANIFIKKNSSTTATGNYWGLDVVDINLKPKEDMVYITGFKVWKDSADNEITKKEKFQHALPVAAYDGLLTPAKLATLLQWMDERVNPPEEEPEA